MCKQMNNNENSFLNIKYILEKVMMSDAVKIIKPFNVLYTPAV